MTTSICNSPAREREKIYVITELYRVTGLQGYRVLYWYITIPIFLQSVAAKGNEAR